MSYVAFFDLDNTILKINSGEALLHRAYKNGLLSTWRLINAYRMAILYKFHLTDPLKIIEKLNKWLANASINEIETLCAEIVEKDLIPAIHPEIITEIRKHKEQGAHLVILSSAINSICFRIAQHLEMHSVISSELEVLNQHYTGRPKGRFCFRNEKLNRINQYLQTTNFTLEDSWYFADSIDDLTVLQAVGHAICINPDARLEKIACKNNWVIHKWD